MNCDFCGRETGDDYTVKYCDPFIISTPLSTFIDGGEWSACEDCAPLVDDDNIGELLQRAYRQNGVAMKNDSHSMHLKAHYQFLFTAFLMHKR